MQVEQVDEISAEDAAIINKVKDYTKEIVDKINARNEPYRTFAEFNAYLNDASAAICDIIKKLNEEQQDKFLQDEFGRLAKLVLDERVIMNEAVSKLIN